MHTTKVTKNSERQPSEGFIDLEQKEAIEHLRKFIPDLGDDLVVEGNVSFCLKNIERIPDGLTVKGSLDLRRTYLLTKFPKRLTVLGTLYLGCSGILFNHIPEDLSVKGDLWIDDVIYIPDNFTIGGSLHLNNYTSRLPDNLTVCGSLDISRTEIHSLPKGLRVHGDLRCNGQKLTEVPGDLYVGGHLGLGSTKVRYLPPTVQFGGLSLSGTEIKVFPKHITRVMGELDISNTAISILPAGLTVYGDLNLDNTNVIGLPDDLIVKGSLHATETAIDRLPETIQISHNIYLSDCPISELPENLCVNGSLYLDGTFVDRIPSSLIVKDVLCLDELRPIEMPAVLNAGDTHLPYGAICPDGFTVNGDLRISDNYRKERKPNFRKLPKDLTVTGDLVLWEAKVNELPRGLKVHGDLRIQFTPIAEFPDDLQIGSQLIYDHSIPSSLLIQFAAGNWAPPFEVVLPEASYKMACDMLMGLADRSRKRMRKIGDKVLFAPACKSMLAPEKC